MIKLRIVSGTLKNRYVKLPEKGTHFRPTLERTRQSIADSLTSRLYGADCADVCAGSGAFGFELISRGAARVDFIESDRKRASLIEHNARELGIIEQCTILCTSVQNFISTRTSRYDILFYDPPYDIPDLISLVPSLQKLVKKEGIVLFQHRKGNQGETDPAQGLRDCRVYGDSAVDYLGSLID